MIIPFSSQVSCRTTHGLWEHPFQNITFCCLTSCKTGMKIRKYQLNFKLTTEWIIFTESKNGTGLTPADYINKIQNLFCHSSIPFTFKIETRFLGNVTVYFLITPPPHVSILHSFQPRRTFCILCAATLASSSESDSLWDVELWEVELQGDEHSGEHR